MEASNKLSILVTGCAGFIGSHLTDELLEDYEVFGIDNLVNGKLENIDTALENKSFHFIKGDILSKEVCMESTRNIDIVYHLACLGVRHSIHNPLENHRVNAEGTLNLLEASLSNKVKKFFYISTSEVYGDINIFPIHEQATPKPKTVYGSSKLAGENYAYSFFKTYGLDATILRIFNNYGPRAHYEGDAGEIIPRSIVRILYDLPPVLFGDGTITRDFLYVKDTATVLKQLINFKENISGEIINIGTGIEITMKELLQKILTLMEKDKKLNIEYMDSRPADVPRLWVDNKKFLQLTNFKSAYSFENAMLNTISFYKKLSEKRTLIEGIQVKNWEK